MPKIAVILGQSQQSRNSRMVVTRVISGNQVSKSKSEPKNAKILEDENLPSRV